MQYQDKVGEGQGKAAAASSFLMNVSEIAQNEAMTVSQKLLATGFAGVMHATGASARVDTAVGPASSRSFLPPGYY